MRKTFLLLITGLSIFVLTACKAKPINYKNDQLLVEPTYTSISVKDGISFNDLNEQKYDYGVYESNIINEDGKEFVYKRLFFVSKLSLGQMMLFSTNLIDYYEEIIENFEDINDIEYIIYNKDLNIISILPKETEDFMSNNSVIIDVQKFVDAYNDEHNTDLDLSRFNHFHGINFRDLFVSQLNSQNDEKSFEVLQSVFFYVSINYTNDINIRYIDIKIDVKNNIPVYVSSYIDNVAIIYSDSSYKPIEGIPIDIIQDFSDLSNDTDEMIKDDIIITSDMDSYIDFYYTNKV